LRSPERTDDDEALRNLGLNSSDWFNNRTGEIYGYNGETPITYG